MSGGAIQCNWSRSGWHWGSQPDGLVCCGNEKGWQMPALPAITRRVAYSAEPRLTLYCNQNARPYPLKLKMLKYG